MNGRGFCCENVVKVGRQGNGPSGESSYYRNYYSRSIVAPSDLNLMMTSVLHCLSLTSISRVNEDAAAH